MYYYYLLEHDRDVFHTVIPYTVINQNFNKSTIVSANLGPTNLIVKIEAGVPVVLAYQAAGPSEKAVTLYLNQEGQIQGSKQPGHVAPWY